MRSGRIKSIVILAAVYAIVLLLAGAQGGCGAGYFQMVRPDGTKVSGGWVHVVSNPTITGAKMATTQATVQIDGFKSEAQMSALDLLKAAAQLAPKP